jgi:endonuclease/exonuclease/phosphatase family metal-dependent hydrolase
VGYFIKKNLNFFFDIISNKNRLINFNYPQSKALTSEKFSRDVAELHLFNKDREKPFFIFLLTHLKSRLDPNFIDPNGYLRRSAELKALVEIYRSLESRHQNQVPMAVCGDFNGLASRPEYDSEFVELYQQTQLEDVLHLAQVPMDRRATYFQTSRASSPDGKQIDYAFLSPKAQSFLVRDSACVLRFQDEFGQELDPPSNLEAKEKLPSDHYPVLFKLKGIPSSQA